MELQSSHPPEPLVKSKQKITFLQDSSYGKTEASVQPVTRRCQADFWLTLPSIWQQQSNTSNFDWYEMQAGTGI